MPTPGDDVRGSAPVMSSKDLLLELYHDMKVVRPAVEALVSANLPARVTALEVDHAIRDARGGAPETLVERVARLEDGVQDAKAASVERRRLGEFSTKTLAAIVLASNFILGLWVAIANVISTGHP